MTTDAVRPQVFHALGGAMADTDKSITPSREQYARLAPRVKVLKEGTIRKKWRKLPVGTQTKVADLLRSVERPAITHGSNDKKGIEVQAAVSELVQGLIERLPRMPFPPGAHDMSFDFEWTINRQRALEEQLTANTHTIGLLSAEVKEESSLLEQEREELAALERELADLEELDAKQEKRLHPFAQGRRLESSRTIIGEYEMRPVVKAPASTLAELEGDPEAKGLLDQLRHYLDSLQNNIEGTKDISVALAKSQAALDIFNWKHLGTDEYRQVYGIYAT